MSTARIRKIVTTVESTYLEMGRKIDPPTRRAASIAVIENPCAGKYIDDLEALMVIGEELGDLLGRKPLRAAVDKGAALVASSKKMGSMGQVLDVPLGHKDAAYVRSHFDGMEVCINDAPRANEIMVAVAVTDSGRPLPRVGGLEHDAAKGEDGLR